MEATHVFLHKLHNLKCVFDSATSGLYNNILPFIFLKLSLAVANVAVEVNEFVRYTDLPALVATHLWGMDTVLEVTN
jgi:hypothetical protein